MLNTLNRIIRIPWLGRSVQAITCLAFLLLIVIGLEANTRDPAFAKVLRNTNLANLIVWSYWWPLIVFSSVFLGRVWCFVCPLHLVSSTIPKLGAGISPPEFFRSGWAATSFYVLILFVGVHMFDIHRVPLRMATYLIVLFAAVVLVSLLFRGNLFCESVCPAGKLMGIYARLAPFGWGVKDQQVCLDCRDKSCVSKAHHFKWIGQSCSVRLYPAKIPDNNSCLLCAQCLVSCTQNNPGAGIRANPGWLKRRWFQDILNLRPLAGAEVAFALVVSGFVIYEIFTEWTLTKEWLLWAPHYIADALNVSGDAGFGLVKAITLFFFLPLLIWVLPYALFLSAGGNLSPSRYFREFSVAFIPIMAAAHCTKAFLKMTSRIPYWEHTIHDPVGESTASAILDGTIQLAPVPAHIHFSLTPIALLMMVVGILLSSIVITRLLRRLNIPRWPARLFYLIPALYGGGFLIMLVSWRIS